MSLILEALRKSETERRLGRAPDLLSPDLVLAAHRRRRRWPLWLAAPAVLALAAGGAWWLGRQTVPEQAAPSVAANGIDSASPGDPEGPGRRGSRGSGASRDGKLIEPSSRLTPLPQPPLPQAPLPQPPPQPPVSAIPEGPASPEALQALRERLERTARAADADASPATPPPAAAQAAQASNVSDPPSLQTMPAAQRATLPPLKLTLHVYAAEPAARFVILDGRRLGEGSWLTGGLRLAEIRRDGVLLEIEGRPWLLPRP